VSRKRDTRTYITVHDGMPDHPKIDGLSDGAFRLLIELWCWCSRHLTDGRVPPATWGKRGTDAARDELVEANLAHLNGDGSVDMHDYLEHQRSAEEVADLREKRAEAGRKGGISKARGLASATAVAKQTGSKPVAETVSETELVPTEPTEGANKSRKPRRSGVPASFEITRGMRLWAAENAPDIDIDHETAQFLDYHAAKGSVFVDWTRAWHTWIRKSRTFGPRPPRNNTEQDFWDRATTRATAAESRTA
jgi:general stress protein YciG